MRIRIALFALGLAAGPAAAQSPIAEVICAPRAQMLDRLARQYGAERAGMGLRNAETILEIWTSPRGDWTLVQTYASGQMCILAMGRDWVAEGAGPA